MPNDFENGGRRIPQTVFIPNPGGQTIPNFGFDSEEGVVGSARSGVNSLVDLAGSVLELIVYLRNQNDPVDIGQLHQKTVVLIDEFERKALATDFKPMAVNAACYALEATVDDMMMTKPWATDRADGWEHSKLTEGVVAGEKFFDYVRVVRDDQPKEHPELLELLYLCMALGFQGKYRVAGRPMPSQLAEEQKKTFRAIREGRNGQFAASLSDSWQGIDTDRRPMSAFLPTWLVCALSVAACCGIFVWFLTSVDQGTKGTYSLVTAMQPADENGQPIPVSVDSLAVPIVGQPTVTSILDLEKFKTFLSEEIKQELVEVSEKSGNLKILLRGEGMFGPGRTDVLPQYLPVLESVG